MRNFARLFKCSVIAFLWLKIFYQICIYFFVIYCFDCCSFYLIKFNVFVAKMLFTSTHNHLCIKATKIALIDIINFMNICFSNNFTRLRKIVNDQQLISLKQKSSYTHIFLNVPRNKLSIFKLR